MVKSSRGKARRTEVDELIAHLADVINRLYLDSQERDGDTDEEEVSSPPPPSPHPPPPTVYSPPLGPTHAAETTSSAINVLRDSLAALSGGGGGSIAVQTSGPTVIPIMPNVHTVKASACASTAASASGSNAGGSQSSCPCDEVTLAETDIRCYTFAKLEDRDIVSTLVSGVPGAIYRRHTSRQAAEDAYAIALQAGRVSIIV
ncbi:hypothetical protein PUNSTDRAFT_131750 [Punctularia strigosozonata HHB-11173 SS5]|uniref:uncharacterized protein n=1 Tax=Punctularia strigosozonata (strain HHB-11173) TaxID=741275 RepID=UPI0004416B15|nr:uncharacterized protein PUNSTDRAFT_131750 [Punctularia strigosozonata HHB-11173 SS5]EIN11590.1 hypothetical protein PUNSTDRAFT_131750 [Punctularia strigosozonata HHB-11173 SS5]